MMIKRIFLSCILIAGAYLVSGRDVIDSLKQTLSEKSENELAEVYYLIGKEFFPANSDSSLIYTDRALHLYRELDDEKGIYKCLGLLTGVYSEIGMTDTSIEIGFEVLKWAENSKDDFLYANVCLEIGNSMVILNKQEIAKDYYRKAVSGNDKGARLAAYANLGLVYLSLEEPDSAYHYFYSARESYLKKDTTEERILFNLAVLNSNLGSVEYLRNNFKEGIRLVKSGLAIAERLESKTFIAGAYNKLGHGFSELNQPDSAVFYFQKARDLAAEIGYSIILSDAYHYLSDYYAGEKDFKNAWIYFKKFNHLSDSLRTAEEEASLEKLNLKHEIWTKNKNIELLESSNKNLWLSGILVILVLLIVSLVIIVFLNRRRLKLENAKTLAEYKSQKEAFKHEKARNELRQISANIIEQNLLIEGLEEEIKLLKQGTERKIIEEKLVDLHRKKILTDTDWIEYAHAFAELYPGFYAFIKSLDGISEGDRRQLVFIKLGFNLKESSYLMGISTDGIKRARQRLSKKLGLADASKLKDFVDGISESA